VEFITSGKACPDEIETTTLFVDISKPFPPGYQRCPIFDSNSAGPAVAIQRPYVIVIKRLAFLSDNLGDLFEPRQLLPARKRTVSVSLKAMTILL
jgi:hypothetical protein